MLNKCLENVRKHLGRECVLGKMSKKCLAPLATSNQMSEKCQKNVRKMSKQMLEKCDSIFLQKIMDHTRQQLINKNCLRVTTHYFSSNKT